MSRNAQDRRKRRRNGAGSGRLGEANAQARLRSGPNEQAASEAYARRSPRVPVSRYRASAAMTLLCYAHPGGGRANATRIMCRMLRGYRRMRTPFPARARIALTGQETCPHRWASRRFESSSGSGRLASSGSRLGAEDGRPHTGGRADHEPARVVDRCLLPVRLCASSGPCPTARAVRRRYRDHVPQPCDLNPRSDRAIVTLVGPESSALARIAPRSPVNARSLAQEQPDALRFL